MHWCTYYCIWFEIYLLPRKKIVDFIVLSRISRRKQVGYNQQAANNMQSRSNKQKHRNQNKQNSTLQRNNLHLCTLHIMLKYINPLKTIWFCCNMHFPQTPARVYSGLVFNGLKSYIAKLNKQQTICIADPTNKNIQSKTNKRTYQCAHYV